MDQPGPISRRRGTKSVCLLCINVNGSVLTFDTLANVCMTNMVDAAHLPREIARRRDVRCGAGFARATVAGTRMCFISWGRRRLLITRMAGEVTSRRSILSYGKEAITLDEPLNAT